MNGIHPKLGFGLFLNHGIEHFNDNFLFATRQVVDLFQLPLQSGGRPPFGGMTGDAKQFLNGNGEHLGISLVGAISI